MKVKGPINKTTELIKRLNHAGSSSTKVKIVLDGSEEAAKVSAKEILKPSKALQTFAMTLKKLNIF